METGKWGKGECRAVKCSHFTKYMITTVLRSHQAELKTQPGLNWEHKCQKLRWRSVHPITIVLEWEKRRAVKCRGVGAPWDPAVSTTGDGQGQVWEGSLAHKSNNYVKNVLFKRAKLKWAWWPGTTCTGLFGSPADREPGQTKWLSPLRPYCLAWCHCPQRSPERRREGVQLN